MELHSVEEMFVSNAAENEDLHEQPSYSAWWVHRVCRWVGVEPPDSAPAFEAMMQANNDLALAWHVASNIEKVFEDTPEFKDRMEDFLHWLARPVATEEVLWQLFNECAGENGEILKPSEKTLRKAEEALTGSGCVGMRTRIVISTLETRGS